MTSKETLNKVKTLLGIQVSLEQMKLDNGTIIEAEVFAPDNEVFIVSEEERVALPIGEYLLENGKVLIVTEEGIISEIKESQPAEEEPQPEEAPEMAADPAAPKKVVESISKELFFSEIEKLKKEITELKSQSKPKEIELSKEVEISQEVELAEEVKPLKHSPEAKPERELQKFASKRKKTTRDIVFNKLFN